MRIPSTFGERKSVLTSPEPKRKYFFAYEGSETERLYFEGIQSIQNKLGIHALLEIKPLVRSYNENGWSHPQKLLTCLIDYLKQLEEHNYKISLIVSWMVDYFRERNTIDAMGHSEVSLAKEITQWFHTEQGLSSDSLVSSLKDITEAVAAYLKKYVPIQDSIEDFKQYIDEQNTTYAPDYDRVCIIVDRDKQSFKENQYDMVVQKCVENHFRLYVSNPCFEFWLLMHFPEVHALDVNLLHKNPLITARRRYTENELRKLVPGYTKTNIKFEYYVNSIFNAITNEKAFAEDIPALKYNIGSNIGFLLSELIEYKPNQSYAD